MRRAAPTAGLSPQLIKHFAIATVSITALLALFATDADWGAEAQFEAVEAKNRLAAAQAEKLGTKKVIAKLKVRKSTGTSMVYDDAPDISAGGGGGGGSSYPRTMQRSRDGSQGDGEPQKVFGEAATGTLAERAARSRKPATKRVPTEEEREAMLEASRLRSGNSSSDD